MSQKNKFFVVVAVALIYIKWLWLNGKIYYFMAVNSYCVNVAISECIFEYIIRGINRWFREFVENQLCVDFPGCNLIVQQDWWGCKDDVVWNSFYLIF